MPNPYALTQAQLDKIVVDEGVIYLDHGETSSTLLGAIRGGGTFTATATYRDIEVDGKRGKTKGLKVTEEINASLSVTLLSLDQQQVALLTPFVDVGATPYPITSGDVGAVASTKYLKNVTMFCKTLDGKYKKVKLLNVLNEAPLSISAKPKAESEWQLEFHAHWDPVTITTELFTIDEITSIS